MDSKEKDKGVEEATFGAGCFWGVEEAFREIKGIIETESGFSGGTVKSPSYERVCMGDTGHAEVVHLKFDPKKVSYKEILDIFWKIHDPTQVNRQGPDVGYQYRSIIFYHSEKQKEIAEKMKEELEKSGKFSGKIATEIKPFEAFYRAEEYHQKYLMKKGAKVCH